MPYCRNPVTGSSALRSDGSGIQSRHVVNARERSRTQSVNIAFNHLRNLIPTEPFDRKLSKIEILCLAKSYIAHLHAIISTGNYETPCNHFLSPRLPTEDSRMSNVCTFCSHATNNYKKY